ncbi:MAG: hypothetical protein QW688_08345 [Thermoprotei archaeon]
MQANNHYDHHDARYNLGQIAEHLILLQDHYTGNRCADCVLKHLYTVKAYAEEGLTLNNATQVRALLENARQLADKHLQLVQANLEGKIRGEGFGKTLEKMVQDVRRLRQEILFTLHGAGLGEEEHHHSHVEHELGDAATALRLAESELKEAEESVSAAH